MLAPFSVASGRSATAAEYVRAEGRRPGMASAWQRRACREGAAGALLCGRVRLPCILASAEVSPTAIQQGSVKYQYTNQQRSRARSSADV